MTGARPVRKPASQTLARIGEELLAWFRTLVSAAVYATLIVTFGFQVARVDGLSMSPTLEDHDRLIVNKLVYELGDPRPGDIVMLYYPVDPEKMFVKRVIAKEGDEVRIVDGRVYVNDVPLHDDYVRSGQEEGDRLIAEAKEEGSRIVREAEETSHRTLSQLEQERSLLERKIDELRLFERDYRTRLKSYLQNLLGDLDNRGSALPPRSNVGGGGRASDLASGI